MAIIKKSKNKHTHTQIKFKKKKKEKNLQTINAKDGVEKRKPS